MIYYLILLGIGLLGLLYMIIEARYPHSTRVKLGDLGIKVLNISDIHIRTSPTSWGRVKRIIQKSEAEMLLFCGDYIQKKEDIPRFFRFIDYISDSRPMYAVLGNHDIEAFMEEKGEMEGFDRKGLEAFIDEFKSHGITMLVNSSIEHEINGKRLIITGLDDIRYDFADLSVIEEKKDTCCDKHIVLAHNPDTMLSAQCYSFDYMLSGHFHAGQIWLPFNLSYTLLRKDILCKQGMTKGVYKFKTKTLFINRGLGSVVFPFRLFSYPEIAELEL